MKIEELVEPKHPYYGTGNDGQSYDDFKSFYDEMKGYDVDMNLCYRWDVNKKTGEDLTGSDAGYYAELFTVLQRKGRVTSHFIENFTEDDIPLLQEYLKPHIETLQKIWAPFELGTKQEIRNQKIQDII